MRDGMRRDYDPRPTEPERPDISRGSRGASEPLSRHATNPRDVFSRDLDLPRGPSRRPVRDRTHTYELRGSEVRMLATVGAFRVVAAEDLRQELSKPIDPWNGDLRRLREAGLVRTIPHLTGRQRHTLVTLTERGRQLLESHRSRGNEPGRQAFYAGLVKPRELAHDARLYRAYLQAGDRLRKTGVHIRRAVLDYELKRDYQRFLQDLNRQRRANKDVGSIEPAVAVWARAHDLPMVDGHVQFPDVRIEYDHPDGRRAVEDVEVVTPHYRGAYAAAKARTGFTRYRVVTGVGGRGGRSGRGLDPRLAEELLP
jgi:DNA-binding MarR family transcriptional regulator